MKRSLLLGVFSFLAFGVVDLWALPETYKMAYLFRFALAVPVLLWVFLLATYSKRFYRFAELSYVFCGIVCASVIVGIIYNSHPNELAYDTYFAGIIIVNHWISTLSRLRFVNSVSTIFINMLLYVIVAAKFQNYFSSEDLSRQWVFFTNCSFLFTTGIISIFSCWAMEVNFRKDFIQNETLLNDKKTLIENEQVMRETHQKLSQQQLMLANASRLATLGEMAGGVAHEVNNPLNIIYAKIETLRRAIPANDPSFEKMRIDLEKVKIASERIAKIVSGLRTFSRDGGKDEMIEESLSKIVDETISLCRERFLNHRVEFFVDEVPNVQVKCRATQISQVLLNLLNNAFDSVVDQSTAKVELIVIIEGNVARVRVSDSGPGVPSEFQNKIMQPFFTTKPVGKGTGLGLSISKGIIDQHGGILELEPSAQGAVFSFTIPIVKRKGLFKQVI